MKKAARVVAGRLQDSAPAVVAISFDRTEKAATAGTGCAERVPSPGSHYRSVLWTRGRNRCQPRAPTDGASAGDGGHLEMREAASRGGLNLPVVAFAIGAKPASLCPTWQ
jgi:hypothetical protein